jgi:acetylornithine/succinyldiaminopimelate/putrescine aminotransferase
LLPPLIISEQEVAEGVARLERACARLSRGDAAAPKPGSKEEVAQ